MPYFFILPLYVFLVVALLLVGMVARLTRFRRMAPYFWWAALGSVPGFLLANAGVIGGLLLLGHGLKSMQGLSPGGVWNLLTGVAVGGVMLVLPFLASAVGVAIGALGGLYVAWHYRR